MLVQDTTLNIITSLSLLFGDKGTVVKTQMQLQLQVACNSKCKTRAQPPFFELELQEKPVGRRIIIMLATAAAAAASATAE